MRVDARHADDADIATSGGARDRFYDVHQRTAICFAERLIAMLPPCHFSAHAKAPAFAADERCRCCWHACHARRHASACCAQTQTAAALCANAAPTRDIFAMLRSYFSRSWSFFAAIFYAIRGAPPERISFGPP